MLDPNITFDVCFCLCVRNNDRFARQSSRYLQVEYLLRTICFVLCNVNSAKPSKRINKTIGTAFAFLFDTKHNNTNDEGIHLTMKSVNKAELFTM